ncbi:CBL-interacting serine/threonine-protein kinase 20 [Paramyrothecium foliicola]|nr:CBL-interacting serine/threonine-protein kinase 20 [Paramyrothecium foliicola]
MLKEGERFFATSGNIYPGGPSTWHIMDWDQRRIVSVTMDEELEVADPAIEHLQKHVDSIAPDIFEIHVSPQGDLASMSRDPKDDATFCPFYPPLSATKHPEEIKTISRSELEELDRLGPMVDLVTPFTSSEPQKKLVFKYYFLFQRMDFIWHEMGLWMRLPKHPHIVPFDRIVVDELEGRCVGFTTTFIPGGTLEDNKSRAFKMKWLLQLLAVIDELNLNLGISHQDVAPRNLLVDDSTDSLMIFDFNFSIITRDDKLRAIRHEEQNVAEVEQKDWLQHPDVQLDCPVSEICEVLQKWSERRRTGRQIAGYRDAPNFIDWPDTPQPEPSDVVIHYTTGPVTEKKVRWAHQRTKMLKEAPQSIRVPNGLGLPPPAPDPGYGEAKRFHVEQADAHGAETLETIQAGLMATKPEGTGPGEVDAVLDLWAAPH